MSNPSDYDKLRAVWYKKLKDDGFEDIESDDHNLKVWSSKFARKKTLVSWQAKAAYYYMAENFLRDYKFVSNREKVIWEYHANALSIREITRLLKKVRIKTSRMAVWRIVIRLEKIMKKMYMNE